MLIDCYECKAQVSDKAAACPQCGAVSQSDDAIPVIVTDMDMKISSMIWFLLKAAIAAGLSRKGPWRLSRTLATQTGMTNNWLAKQGLLSVKDLWVKIHYPATAR